MDRKEILSHVDHTQLKAYAAWEDIKKLCEEALELHTASVCVPPCYVKRIKEAYPDLNICTVIGFPLGYSVTEAKAAETKKALEDGAGEIDMVINITDVKNGDYDAVEREIRTLKEMTGEKILKVIVETCYLTEEEKIRLCEIVKIKTIIKRDKNCIFLQEEKNYNTLRLKKNVGLKCICSIVFAPYFAGLFQESL